MSTSNRPFGHVEWVRGITNPDSADFSVSLGGGLSYSPEAGVLIPVGTTGVQVNLEMDLYAGSTGTEFIERHNRGEDVQVTHSGDTESIRNRPFFTGSDIVRGATHSKVVEVPHKPYKGEETEIVREADVVYIDPPGSGIWDRTSITRNGNTINIRPDNETRDIVVEFGRRETKVRIPWASGSGIAVVTYGNGKQVIDLPDHREKFVVTQKDHTTFMKRPGWRNFTTFIDKGDNLLVDQPSYDNDTVIHYQD